MFDIIIHNGKIVLADGYTVSPGFICMNSHSDFTLLVHPEAESKIRQGVTTELVGNCGGSPAPVPEERIANFKEYHSYVLSQYVQAPIYLPDKIFAASKRLILPDPLMKKRLVGATILDYDLK